MKKNGYLLSLLLLVVAAPLALAQFPGGPGGPPRSGDGNGRPSRAADPAPTNFEMTTPKGNSKITGYVVDSSLTQAVEYATIALVDLATSKPIDGTVADEKGKFSLTRVPEGTYRLLITFIGYHDKVLGPIKIEKGKDLDVGVVKLSVNEIQLEAVTVTGEKPLIEEKVDRLVYNAEKDMTSQGGDAADILRKVPMLSVDLDGNVSLRGTSNVRVLINNKPSTIVASSIADALRMIPADLIKSVEVITSPSAKYDAEGSGGIINIITKKSTLQGLTLSLDTGVGLRGSNLGLNGSYRKGKLGITLGGNGRAFYNKAFVTLDQTTLQEGTSVLTRQTADAFDNGLFGRYNLGFDYDLGKNQSITAGVNFGKRNFSRDQDFTTNIFRNNVLSGTSYRNVDSRDLSNSVDFNLDYLRTYKPGQEWSVSTLYSVSNLTNNFDADILSEGGSLSSRQRNINGNLNQEVTLQTDYVHPIGKRQQLEVGVKGIFRQVNSDFEYQTAGPTGLFASDVTNPSGFLNYSQNIGAGYLSYTYATANKYTFKLGSRYEYTSISAYDQNADIAIPAYANLVPSLNISKSLSQSSTIKLAYNKRIQRPGLQQLNPNFNAANTQNINIGNPSLRPELTDNLELSLSTNFKKTYLNVSLFGRQTNNGITRIAMPSDTLLGAIVTTWENIGQEQAVGANVFGNVYLTSKWTLNGGVDIFYNYLEGLQQDLSGLSVPVSNAGWVVGGRLQSQLQLPNGWGIQAFGGYRGNRVQLQGSQSGMGMYSLGFRKEFNNKKGSLGLAAENFFGGMKMQSTLTSPLFTQVSVNNIYNQNIKATFSYKIGKMSFVEKKRTKSVRNDDVKSGGEAN
ncbi:outer membrane beta-barrel family protein [Rhabdobacter roseus]|uniref:Outer membrane receptor protein involved in Fe transport n=1 Tax=Rhabdobacter roseus TaxID=1655419 RepID=A0A840TPT8_9BACT|nr:TonB-dependent receptor [Rhabdobacter roseus]MBB5286346.1 outer membrane receptor protein involved in Fe transport [Rhabdobacter roseus]